MHRHFLTRLCKKKKKKPSRFNQSHIHISFLVIVHLNPNFHEQQKKKKEKVKWNDAGDWIARYLVLGWQWLEVEKWALKKVELDI